MAKNKKLAYYTTLGKQKVNKYLSQNSRQSGVLAGCTSFHI